MSAALEALAQGSPWLVLPVKATALLAAAWLLHALLVRSNPRWRVLLWRLALAGLVLLPVSELASPRLTLPVTDTTVAVAPSIATPLPLHESPPLAIAEVGAFASEHAWPLLAGLWSVVALILTARLVAAALQVGRWVREARPAPRPVRQALADMAAAMGVRKVPELRVRPDVSSPFLAGVRRPVLVLPLSMAHRDFARDLPGVLAHELAHVQSRDALWSLVARCLQALLWFHPLMWHVLRAHGSACEHVCDAVASEHTGGHGAYARILARAALEMAGQTPALAGITMIRPSEITRRLRALRRGVCAAALGRVRVTAALTLAAALLTGVGGLELVRLRPELMPAMAPRAPRPQPAASEAKPVEPPKPQPTVEQAPRPLVDPMAGPVVEVAKEPEPVEAKAHAKNARRGSKRSVRRTQPETVPARLVLAPPAEREATPVPEADAVEPEPVLEARLHAEVKPSLRLDVGDLKASVPVLDDEKRPALAPPRERVEEVRETGGIRGVLRSLADRVNRNVAIETARNEGAELRVRFNVTAPRELPGP